VKKPKKKKEGALDSSMPEEVKKALK